MLLFKSTLLLLLVLVLSGCGFFWNDGNICDEEKVICDSNNGTAYSASASRKWDFSKATMLTLEGGKPKEMRMKVIMRYAAGIVEGCNWTSVQQGSNLKIRHTNAFVFIIPAGKNTYKVRAPLTIQEKDSTCQWNNLGVNIQGGHPFTFEYGDFDSSLKEGMSYAYGNTLLKWNYHEIGSDFAKNNILDVLPKTVDTLCQKVHIFGPSQKNNPNAKAGPSIYCKYDNQRWETARLDSRFKNQDQHYKVNIRLSKDIQCINCLKDSQQKPFTESFFPEEVQY